MSGIILGALYWPDLFILTRLAIRRTCPAAPSGFIARQVNLISCCLHVNIVIDFLGRNSLFFLLFIFHNLKKIVLRQISWEVISSFPAKTEVVISKHVLLLALVGIIIITVEMFVSGHGQRK